MADQRIEVIAYAGDRGEEIPRAMIFHGKRIEVIKILYRWIEEGIEDRIMKRFFKVSGSDGLDHKIYYDEMAMEWFYVPK
jgi:hypothetical protein